MEKRLLSVAKYSTFGEFFPPAKALAGFGAALGVPGINEHIWNVKFAGASLRLKQMLPVLTTPADLPSLVLEAAS